MGKKEDKNRRQRKHLYFRQRGRCAYCDEKMILGAKDGDPRQATIDHIKPRSLGGSNALKNKVLVCWECNNRKADHYI